MLHQKLKSLAVGKEINQSRKPNPYSIFPYAMPRTAGAHSNLMLLDRQEPKLKIKARMEKNEKENQGENVTKTKDSNCLAQKTSDLLQGISASQNLIFSKNKMESQSTFQKVEQTHQTLCEGMIIDGEILWLSNITNQMVDESSGVEGNKENCSIVGNFLAEKYRQESADKDQNLVINLKKKIKKLQKPKRVTLTKATIMESEIRIWPECLDLGERQAIALAHAEMLSHPYEDIEVIPDASIYRNQLISQRIDNDVESNDEQVALGVNRLHRFLSEAVELNMDYSRRWVESEGMAYH